MLAFLGLGCSNFRIFILLKLFIMNRIWNAHNTMRRYCTEMDHQWAQWVIGLIIMYGIPGWQHMFPNHTALPI